MSRLRRTLTSQPRAKTLLDWVQSVDAGQKERRGSCGDDALTSSEPLRGLPDAHAREIESIRETAANKRAALE